MPRYRVTDYTGATSVQDAPDPDEAIQGHLLDYGLLHLKEEPLVETIDKYGYAITPNGSGEGKFGKVNEAWE